MLEETEPPHLLQTLRLHALSRCLELTDPRAGFTLNAMDLFEEIVRMRRSGRRGALGTVGGGCVEADVWAAAKEVMQKEAPRKMVFHLNNEASYDNGLICGGTVEVFIEPILPQPLLYLFGGGHVSTAVAKAAHSVGFGVGVADYREAFANAQRFPMAQEIFTSF